MLEKCKELINAEVQKIVKKRLEECKGSKKKIAKLRQSCDSYCMQKIANDNFCMHCCNWQLLFALLLLTIFVCMTFSVCTIAIDTFLYALLYTLITFIFTIANNHSFHMYYSHWKIVHKLLQVTTFVYTIAIDNFCMHCQKRQLLYSLLHLTTTIINFFKHCITLLQLLIHIDTIAINYLCMHYCSC